MAYKTKERCGSLFLNGRKEKPGHPDYEGQLRINGVLYRLSGWRRESKAGTRWLSLSIRPDEREAASTAAPAAAVKDAEQAAPF